MSQETGKRQPKPFLKKGTRQFLSNAQTRSLNQKPKIVDFADQENGQSPMNAVTFGKAKQEQLKITVKKSTFKDPEIKVNVPNKTKQNKPFKKDTMVKDSMSANKRKPAGLQDYLGISSQNKKNHIKDSFSKQKSPTVSIHNPPSLTMAAMLSRQEQIADSDEEPFVQQPIPPKSVKALVAPSRPIQPSPPTTHNPMFESGQVEEVHFNSDSDEELPKPNNMLKSKAPAAAFKKSVAQRNRWDQEQQQGDAEQPQRKEAGSKIFQKFYQKEDPKRITNKIQPQKADVLTIDKIPKELRQQIINQHILDKKCQIQNKLLAVQQAEIKARQQKQKYEEMNKTLTKQKQEYKKQYESKMKEVDEKFKSENQRITREKRYLKGHQEGAKGDWKLKNELEQLRGKLTKMEKEKKDLKVKLQGEIDRLQGKVEDLSQQNQHLKQSIKFIEKQKLQLKTKVCKQVEKKVQLPKQINYWEGAPTRSYLFMMTEPNFSLLDLDLSCFNFENLEHYQYYLAKKDEKVNLEKENNDSDEKLIRIYQNGKEQIQYVNRLLKQKFPAPFNFTVVSFINGDSKFIYPEGIQIYYDNRGQITEFKLGAQKTIYNFHKLGQLELKYRHPQLGQIHELRKNDIVVRNTRRGEQRFKKLSNGTVQQIG